MMTDLTNPDRRHLLGAAAAIVSLSATGVQAAEPNPALYGTWNGVVRAGSVEMGLRLTIERDGSAIMVSLDEAGDVKRASKVTLDGDTVDIRFESIFAGYKAKLEGGRLVGRWKQLIHDLPLVMQPGAGSSSGRPIISAQPLTAAGLAAVRRKKQIPALGAGWERRGQPSRVLVDGLRSSRADLPVSPADQWHWGSITKSMTATLIARYVDAGDLAWDDTVSKVLGPRVADMRPEYASATLLELLSHRSGLAGNLGQDALKLFAGPPAADPLGERLAFARAALRQKPDGARGKYAYSNNGYVIAAAMLEARTGQPWEELMRQRLFAPLQLRSAGFGAPGTPGRIDQPLGHYEPAWNWRDGRPRDPAPLGGKRLTDNVPAMGPAGTVHMSIGDMLVYLAAHRDRPASLLTQASWTRLHTPAFGGSYALGWEVRGDGSLWHNGSNTLWYGEVLVDAKAGVVAAAVANEALEDVTYGVVGQTLAGAYAAA